MPGSDACRTPTLLTFGAGGGAWGLVDETVSAAPTARHRSERRDSGGGLRGERAQEQRQGVGAAQADPRGRGRTPL